MTRNDRSRSTRAEPSEASLGDFASTLKAIGAVLVSDGTHDVAARLERAGTRGLKAADGRERLVSVGTAFGGAAREAENGVDLLALDPVIALLAVPVSKEILAAIPEAH